MTRILGLAGLGVWSWTTFFSFQGSLLAQGPREPALIAARLGTRIETREIPYRGTDVRFGEATGVVRAPLPAVRSIVLDYGRYKEFLPHFHQSRVLARRGPLALIYLEASIIQDTTTLWAQLKLRDQGVNKKGVQNVDGAMVKGNMDHFLASWELAPLDKSQTLVRFRILVEPDLPLPDALFTRENVKAALKTLQALRKRAKEFGASKRTG